MNQTMILVRTLVLSTKKILLKLLEAKVLQLLEERRRKKVVLLPLAVLVLQKREEQLRKAVPHLQSESALILN
jgi:hypothetical protein